MFEGTWVPLCCKKEKKEKERKEGLLKTDSFTID